MQMLIPELAALFQVLMIDLLLAGDNAVVVGLAVAGLPRARRRQAIIAGILFATIIRIGFALVALKLLEIIGLMLAGGLLLICVCWKMYSEIRRANHPAASVRPAKSFRQAMLQIIIADVSMSLDNVLAVAGAAHEHPAVMVAGLLLSVLLMGAAANLVAALLEKYRSLAWLGLLVVFGVAVKLIWEGGHQVASAM
jgi:YjbE family integral membrane protein